MTKRELTSNAKMAAMNFANNPKCSAFFRKCLVRKCAALNNDLSLKAIADTLEDILLIGQFRKEGRSTQ